MAQRILPPGFTFNMTQETDWCMDPDEAPITEVKVTAERNDWLSRILNKKGNHFSAITEIDSSMSEMEISKKVDDLFEEVIKQVNEAS